MTKQIYSELQKIERHLYTAYQADYIVGMTSSEIEILFNSYNNLFNKSESSKSCTKCRLRLGKTIYPLYNEYKEKELNKTKTEKPKPTKKTTTKKKK